MRFDTASPTPKLIFKPLRALTEEEYNTVQHLKDSSEAISAITLTVAQTDNVKETKQPVLTAPAASEEVIDEPKKAEPKKAPVANEPKLEDLVGEWDDI
jgi:hypothetical protein